MNTTPLAGLNAKMLRIWLGTPTKNAHVCQTIIGIRNPRSRDKGNGEDADEARYECYTSRSGKKKICTSAVRL